VPELDWPKVLLIAVLALGLFFGVNYYYQHHFKKEPFIDKICCLEGVAAAEIVSENGSELLIITPEPSYRGSLQELFVSIEKEIADDYRKPLHIEIKDKRSARLDQFAVAVSPALYEAARSGCYREAAAEITEIAAAYGLTEPVLTVDSCNLYLQARDDAGFLYQVVPLPPFQEGETANA